MPYAVIEVSRPFDRCRGGPAEVARGVARGGPTTPRTPSGKVQKYVVRQQVRSAKGEEK